MQPRIPAPSISRTYVRVRTNERGERRYEASVFVAQTGQKLTSTRTSYRAALKEARRKAGIRT